MMEALSMSLTMNLNRKYLLIEGFRMIESDKNNFRLDSKSLIEQFRCQLEEFWKSMCSKSIEENMEIEFDSIEYE